MKTLLAAIGLFLLSICSAAVVLGFISSYGSGYGLVIENHNATALALYFATGDGGPATAFTQFHQQMRKFPKVSIGANSVLSTNFESSGEPPRGAFVSDGSELRDWRFDAQTGGRVAIPEFKRLPKASPAAVAGISSNWNSRGILAMVIQVTIVATTLLLWVRKFRPQPRGGIVKQPT